jgi:OOP family OmpA-OmpF porin
MNIKKAIALTGLVAVTAGISLLASAQDAGFYAGAAVGQSRISDACEGVTVACDDKDTAWKVFGGYQFNKNFGAEVGYVDLGKATANGVITGVTVSADAKVKGFEVLGVGTLPIANNFSAYGKLGFFRWDLDVSATGVISGFSATVSASETGTDFTFGLGLKYDFAKNIGARLEWQRYNDIGKESTTGKSDADLFSLGIVFKF